MHLTKTLSILLLLLTTIISGCSTSSSTGKTLGEGKIAIPTYKIKAPATGKILGLISEKGERISKGQPLFAIADDNLDQAVKDTATQLALAKAEMKRLQQGTALPTPAVDISAAQADFYAAQQKASKMNNLLAQGAVSRNQAQAAQRELQEASIRLHTAAQAGTQMQPASPQSLDEQKKRIEQLRTQHQAALLKQQANEATSPCTGIITAINAKINDIAQKGQLILEVLATDTCTVTFNVNSNMAKELKVNQKVELKADSLPAPFPGKITNITGNTVTVTSEKKPENLKDDITVQIISAE